MGGRDDGATVYKSQQVRSDERFGEEGDLRDMLTGHRGIAFPQRPTAASRPLRRAVPPRPAVVEPAARGTRCPLYVGAFDFSKGLFNFTPQRANLCVYCMQRACRYPCANKQENRVQGGIFMSDG